MDANASTATTGRRFPYRLCEVLETEYAVIHGKHPARPTWLLDAEQVNCERLVEVLRRPSYSQYPLAVEAIVDRLRQLAGTGDAADPLDPAQLIDRLNTLLADPAPLFEHDFLDHATDAWQLAEAWPERTGATATPAQGTAAAEPAVVGTGDDATLRNRLLLEAALPASAVARADSVRLAALYRAVHALRGNEHVRTALCLSGGGIRSASFSLGVLQALARARILEKFDYLSTVSGGGYIGSWLSTWIHRHPAGLSGVVDQLAAVAQEEGGNFRRKLRPEAGPLRFLRSYSHFLNPKTGLFSADTWSWIGLYLRNLSLNWLVLIPLLLFVITLPRLYAGALFNETLNDGTWFPALIFIASVCVVLTLVTVTVNRPSISDPVRPERHGAMATRLTAFRLGMEELKRQKWIVRLGIAPLALAALIATFLSWNYWGHTSIPLGQALQLVAASPWGEKPRLVLLVAVSHLVLWGELLVVIAWVISSLLIAGRDWNKRLQELVVMLFAGLLTWGLIDGLGEYATSLTWTSSSKYTFGPLAVKLYPAHLVTIFAMPVLMLAVLAGMTLFIGLESKARWIQDEDREWWARFGAWALIVMAGWIVFAATTLIGPALLLEFPQIMSLVGGTSGLFALIVGRSSLTAATPSSSTAAKAGPVGMLALVGVNTLATASVIFFIVFLAALALVASGVIQHLVPAITPWVTIHRGCNSQGEAWPGFAQANVFQDPEVHLELACQAPLEVTGLLLFALALLLVVASGTLNLNKFSLHAAYRIRIVRTFLGASRRADRRPNPFTGFDPLDNLYMHELQPGLLHEGDIVDLRGLVDTLRDALDPAQENTPAGKLVRRMCRHDTSGVLQARLEHAGEGRPVLKALERDVLEALNRVLQSAPPDESGPFADVLAQARRGPVALPAPDSAAFKQHMALERVRRSLDRLRRESTIFANRVLLDATFADDIVPFGFPPPPPHRLLHVINVTLNLVRGKRLAWQERKAAPFAITPMHCGSYFLGYRAARDYGGPNGISIGTAAAISGAAVSPNMGYSSSPVAALLLTLFNVRLGWWLGNPGLAGNKTYRLREPRFSFRPLIEEALGLTDDRSPYVYLSDGGHFENLGLFEMVLRRCHLIVIVDAGADPDYQFEDLGNAVRKVRIDLGIPIDFPPMPIRKAKDAKEAADGRYCALGRIRYSAIDGPDAVDGIVVLFKPVVYGGEPRDVTDYAARRKPFPQESTVDQFFSESQFESYRKLGDFATAAACGAVTGDGAPAFGSVPEFVEAVRKHAAPADVRWVEAWLAIYRGEADTTVT